MNYLSSKLGWVEGSSIHNYSGTTANPPLAWAGWDVWSRISRDTKAFGIRGECHCDFLNTTRAWSDEQLSCEVTAQVAAAPSSRAGHAGRRGHLREAPVVLACADASRSAASRWPEPQALLAGRERATLGARTEAGRGSPAQLFQRCCSMPGRPQGKNNSVPIL